jgi:hypothetical protein
VANLEESRLTVRDPILHFFELLRRFLNPTTHRSPTGEYCAAHVYPYSCGYVGGPTVRSTGERPPRGEDGPLVRPYFVAHESEMEARRLAELRQNRRILVLPRGMEVVA